MEREKMIDEMQEYILGLLEEASKKEELKMYRWQELPVYVSIIHDLAEDLHNIGYRKIPDGAVVLTKEECDSKVILDEDHFRRVLDNERDQARKETAREILDEVSKHYGGSWLVELYRKYGAEVE